MAAAFWYALPAAVAAMLAALSAGLVEALYYQNGLGPSIASIGFSARYAVAFGLLLILLMRGVLAAWRIDDLAERLVEQPDNVAPRLAAWLVFLLISSCVITTAGFNAVRFLVKQLRYRDVVALASTLAFMGLFAAVFTLSRPTVDLLHRGFRRLGRRRLGRALMRPRALLIGLGTLLSGLLYLSWRISFVPRIGHLDLGIETFAVVYLPVLVGGFLAVNRWASRTLQALFASVLAISCSLSFAGSMYYRYERPFVMLDIWGTHTVSGRAIDFAYDLEEIRSAFDLSEIAPVPRSDSEPQNVVLITIDTLRADYTPVYGGKAKMPNLKAFAEASTVFEWAFSPSNVTRRSLPAIVTGLSPLKIKGRVKGWGLAMDPRHVLLAERFQAAGYDTAGFFCCSSIFGNHDEHRLGTVRGIEHLVIDQDEQKLAQVAAAWLEARIAKRGQGDGADARPAFMWLHMIRPHGWNEVYKGDKSLRNNKMRYERALADTDEWLTPVYGILDRSAVKDSTIVAITSDHGEGLGQHGNRFHSSSLFNAQIHVPLIVRIPDTPTSRRIRQPVSLIDIAPTLMDAAGFQPPSLPKMDGISLKPLIRGDIAPNLDAVVLSHQIRDRSVGTRIDAMIAGHYKLIVHDRQKPKLFNLRSDSREKKNLALDKPDLVVRLKVKLDARIRALHAVSPFE